MANPLGAAPGIMVGVGVGTAAAAALEPLIEPGRQQAWADHPNRVLDPGLNARLAAQGAIPLGDAQAQAKREGIAADKLNALVYLAQHVPEWSQVRDLINRRLISPAQRDDALQRHAYPAEWLQPLRDLMAEILSPGELAAAIHRGLVPNPDILLGEQPQGPFKVDAYPVQPIDPVREAAGSGYNKERLAVLVGLQGLPMGVIEAAHAYYRGIITHGDYIRAFNESNSRNEWASAVLDYARQIPTARDFFENALRGYHDLAWAQDQAKRHGMSPADSLVIYQNQGRPMNVHAITQALARGGVFKPEKGELTDPYEASIVEGNLKPAYYDLAKANRYTYPSAFVIKALATAGDITTQEAENVLLYSGWEPTFAAKVAQAWKPKGAGTDTPWADKARTQLWGTAHRSFIAAESSGTIARNALAKVGVPVAERDTVIELWTTERDLIRRQLTPAQVKKAYAKATRNYATGAPWTRDDALAALVARGYSVTDANDYLDLPASP